MTELPKALAMIICDEMIEDKRTNKKSLIGLFNRIVTNQFPSRHKKMNIFFSLTGGRGKYKTRLQQTYLPEMKVLGEIEGEIEFTDPTAVMEFNFELNEVAFPYEGKYNFQLLIDNTPVIERIFEVVKG
ncbi:MAG: hypothetical protein HY447_01085 [Candidatus Omnitrophica bacterium]|nr:hypothetical protein [Candidatus Omnitrophota bacterium]